MRHQQPTRKQWYVLTTDLRGWGWGVRKNADQSTHYSGTLQDLWNICRVSGKTICKKFAIGALTPCLLQNARDINVRNAVFKADEGRHWSFVNFVLQLFRILCLQGLTGPQVSHMKNIHNTRVLHKIGLEGLTDALLRTIFCTVGSALFSEILTSSTGQKNSQWRLVDVVGHTTYRTAKHTQHRVKHH